MALENFIQEYFVNPMKYPEKHAPYNIYNTAIYAIIALISAYFIFKLLKRLKIEINSEFYNSVFPFIIFGSVLRIFEDAKILPREMELFGITLFPLISPQIYILVFFVVIFSLFLSLKKQNSLQTFRKIGIFLSAILFLLLLVYLFKRTGVNSLWISIAIIIIAILPTYMLFTYFPKLKESEKEINKIERKTFFSQMLDASATFFGVAYAGYKEQHVLANFLFSIFKTPFSFYLLKLLFVTTIILVLRKEAKNKQEQIYILLLITIFGLAPGLRDLLRIFFQT